MLHSTTYAVDAHTWRPLLCDLGLSETEVMRKAGLPEDLLNTPAIRLTSTEFYRLWQLIETMVGAGPLFPLRICAAVRVESFCPPLFAALCSPNLNVAAQRLALFKKLNAPLRIKVIEEQAFVSLDFEWLDNAPSPPPSLVLAELLLLVCLARIGTREEICPLRVVTDIELPSSAYHDFFGTNVERGDKHQLTFAANDARKPFLTLNDSMWKAFEPELNAKLAQLDSPAVQTQRVRSALLEALPTGMITIQDIAERLTLSRRTLQRKLAEEGTTFVSVVQEIRKSLAINYLTETNLSVAEISFLLGFDEPNSFSRAFRIWVGTPPDLMRRQTQELRLSYAN